jgi:hypothetical protein
MRRALICLLMLGACAHAEPRVITKTVNVPVAVPCAVEVREPEYVDTDDALKNAPDIYQAAKLYVIGRLQRLNALEEYRAALKACR